MGGPATRHSKTSKQARLVEKKVCFISDAGNSVGGGWQTSVQRPNPPLIRRGESIYRQSQQGRGGRGQHAETAQSSVIVIFKLVISGLLASSWLF